MSFFQNPVSSVILSGRWAFWGHFWRLIFGTFREFLTIINVCFFIAGSWERPRQFCHPLSKKGKRVYDRKGKRPLPTPLGLCPKI